VEALSGICALALYLSFPLLECLIYFAFVSSLIVISFIDLDYKIIPDVISVPGVAAGFLCSFGLSRITYIDSLLGIALGGGTLLAVAFIYYAITKHEGMGGGDVKLLAMIGAFLGPKAVIATIFISSLLGSAVGLLMIMLKGKDRKYAIPFGPFLAIGAVIFLFWGEPLIALYQRLSYGG
jgi:leader peptidase (prepilin peptidase)/N-methyltransferase